MAKSLLLTLGCEDALLPNQYGVGSPGGVEPIVYLLQECQRTKDSLQTSLVGTEAPAEVDADSDDASGTSHATHRSVKYITFINFANAFNTIEKGHGKGGTAAHSEILPGGPVGIRRAVPTDPDRWRQNIPGHVPHWSATGKPAWPPPLLRHDAQSAGTCPEAPQGLRCHGVPRRCIHLVKHLKNIHGDESHTSIDAPTTTST